MIKWFRKRKPAGDRDPAPEREARPGDALAPEPTAETVPESQPEPAPKLVSRSVSVSVSQSLSDSDSGPPEQPLAAPDDAPTAPPPPSGPSAEAALGIASVADAAEAAMEAQRPHFFRRLRERLQQTRERLSQRVDRVLLGKKVIDDELLDQLEEALITSDLGGQTTSVLLARVADKVRRRELTEPGKLRGQLQEEIRGILEIDAPPLDLRSNRPFVIMVAGVNGVGKTTTIGKLARLLKEQGLQVLLVAGDTFRAAAIEQLSLWGERVGVPVVKQQSGSDPSAVVFDGIDAALSRAADVVIIDTAGRMHTKVNLMEELKKVQRVMRKKLPTAPHEILLVLDATTGQNALSQARLFQQTVGVTGLVLTKLDGTAKGGIVVAICAELKVPVRFIGIGEGMDDLRPFDARAFAEALF